jgi:hypothetical protein
MLGENVYNSIRENIPSTIDLTSQPDGLYFIHISNEKGKRTKKLIIY